MTRVLLQWILNAIALLIVAHVIPGFHVSSFFSALVAVLIIGFLNATLGLILKVLTFPLGIVTLGLFFLVVNALMLSLASHFTPGFQVHGFFSALLGAIVLSVLHMLFRVFESES